MKTLKSHKLVFGLSVALCFMVSQTASAQRGGGRTGFFLGGISRLRLASIEKIQDELNLTDEQSSILSDINEKVREDSRALRNDGGDRASRRDKMTKLFADAGAKMVAKLDDAQKKRLTEIFIQINGASVITDKEVSAALKFSEEQKKALAEATTKNGEARREAFRNFRDMSSEERADANAKIRKESNDRMLAVLTDDQRRQFEEMKGEAFEIDRSLLRRRRGGRGGR